MPLTESQRRAQKKYLSNPENRQRKNKYDAEYKKAHNYKYEISDEQNEQYRLASIVRRRTKEEKLKIYDELLKHEEIQKIINNLNT